MVCDFASSNLFFGTDFIANPFVIQRAIALWILKSRELHHIPMSIMNFIIDDVQSLINLIIGNLEQMTMSELSNTRTSISEIQESVSQNYKLNYDTFQKFRTESMQLLFFRQQLNLVVSTYVS